MKVIAKKIVNRLRKGKESLLSISDLKKAADIKSDGNRVYSFYNWFVADDNYKENFPFTKLLGEKNNWKYCKAKPELLYFSVFGKRKIIEKSKAEYKIFFTGEDTEVRFTDYKNNAIDIADISLGFLPKTIMEERYGKDICKNYIRYPLWLLYYFACMLDKDNIHRIVKEFNERKFQKTKFASLVASHDDFGIRKELVGMLSSIDSVCCAGKFMHNDDDLYMKYNDDKVKYLSQFKFNICPENVSTPGYTTEKIFQSFDAGCIPIYYGGAGCKIEEGVINNESIILYKDDKSNGEEIINIVAELNNNEKLYNDFISKPFLLDSSVDWIYNKNKELSSLLNGIIK